MQPKMINHNLFGEKIVDLIQNGFFEKNHLLQLTEIPSNKNIEKAGFHTNSESIKHFITGRCQSNIPLGEEFNIIFRSRDIESFQKIPSRLVYTEHKIGQPSQYIPKEYTAFCSIDFYLLVPELLKFLKPENEKFDLEKHDYVYLANKDFINNINL